MRIAEGSGLKKYPVKIFAGNKKERRETYEK